MIALFGWNSKKHNGFLEHRVPYPCYGMFITALWVVAQHIEIHRDIYVTIRGNGNQRRENRNEVEDSVKQHCKYLKFESTGWNYFFIASIIFIYNHLYKRKAHTIHIFGDYVHGRLKGNQILDKVPIINLIPSYD